MSTDRITPLVERLHRGKGACAQICVIHNDRVVLDRAVGCASDALFYIYSSSKPFVALLVHLLAERGKLSLDDAVAAYWPQFGQSGKASVTIRHALQHRAGIPVPGGILAMLMHMHDWNKSVRDVELARPNWPAGEVVAYHFISYGFILGELVQRVTGRPLVQVLRAELLEPLGLREVYLGLPDHALARAVPVRAGGPAELGNQIQFNRRRVRQAVVPAAGISTTAAQLARFYQMLVRGGELDGVRVLQEASITEARRPSSDGVVDAFIKRGVRWSQGFQLGGPAGDPRSVARAMGMTSSPRTFGHAGNVSCVAWADPGRRLVLAYLSNVQPSMDRGFEQLGEISDAVLAAF